MQLTQSHALHARAEKALAGGPATLSKSFSRFPAGVSPLFLDSASGCYVWDVDGQRYIDTVAALGPILLGHCDAEVTAAVVQQASLSTSLTLPHRLEVEVAELLQPMTPWGTNARVRFGKNGMDATNAAVRLARYATGGAHILCSGYHGGTDWYMASTDKAGGILPCVAEYTHQIPFGDIAAFEKVLDITRYDLAGMILEIPPRPWGEEWTVVAHYLDYILERIHDAGGLLILDEIVTGFRYPFAWKMYRCTPDLLCLGKGIANGYPLSVVAGPGDIMQGFEGGEVFWSTTFGGETISLASAKATITQLTTTVGPQVLLEYGNRYGTGMTRLIQKHGLASVVTLLGNHARMILRWEDIRSGTSGAALKTLWIAENIQRGVLYGGPIFPMTCWTANTVTTLLHAADEVFGLIAEGLRTGTIDQLLPCPPITDVFNSRYQETAEADRVQA